MGTKQRGIPNSKVRGLLTSEPPDKKKIENKDNTRNVFCLFFALAHVFNYVGSSLSLRATAPTQSMTTLMRGFRKWEFHLSSFFFPYCG